MYILNKDPFIIQALFYIFDVSWTFPPSLHACRRSLPLKWPCPCLSERGARQQYGGGVMHSLICRCIFPRGGGQHAIWILSYILISIFSLPHDNSWSIESWVFKLRGYVIFFSHVHIILITINFFSGIKGSVPCGLCPHLTLFTQILCLILGSWCGGL